MECLWHGDPRLKPRATSRALKRGRGAFAPRERRSRSFPFGCAQGQDDNSRARAKADADPPPDHPSEQARRGTPVRRRMTTRKATAKATADPYGMTTKKAKAKARHRQTKRKRQGHRKRQRQRQRHRQRQGQRQILWSGGSVAWSCGRLSSMEKRERLRWNEFGKQFQPAKES
jgi:hypothetical protein